MNQRIAAAVLSCIACAASTTTLTRITATGGAFGLVGGSAESLRISTRRALDGMKQRCNGPYEITAIHNMAQPPGTMAYYLDTNGAAASGAYQTELEFDCRQPQSVALNQMVEKFSRSTDVMKKCNSDRECEADAFICFDGYCRKTY